MTSTCKAILPALGWFLHQRLLITCAMLTPHGGETGLSEVGASGGRRLAVPSSPCFPR